MNAFSISVPPNLTYFRLNQNLNLHTLFRIANINNQQSQDIKI